MVNRNGKKGSSFERLIADHFKECWPDRAAEFIDRQVKMGSRDVGDLCNVRLGSHKLAVEIKTVRSMDLSGWLREAQEEAENLGAVAGVVVHKRIRHGKPGEQYITMTVDDLINIIHAARSEQ
ncbi:holliday junction resolvase [Mycobacterium phage ScoobyDoobyDoo]|nr:holliday junction resolvase [Mycobacterium phage ScoobyDoobyDoo]